MLYNKTHVLIQNNQDMRSYRNWTYTCRSKFRTQRSFCHSPVYFARKENNWKKLHAYKLPVYCMYVIV